MSRRNKLSRAAKGALLGLYILTATTMAAQETGQAPERELYLEVFINGQPSQLITRFVDIGGGALLADAQELANTGILPDAEGRQGDIRVDRLPGVSFEINEADQTLHFTAAETALAARVIAATPQAADPSGEEVDGGFGLVLNYNLALDVLNTKGGGTSQFAAADFDARMFTQFGALSHGFSVAKKDAAGSLHYQRLETFWRSAMPNRAVQFQIGDITTRGPSWARPVRLGGITIERNFALRPDLVTIPLPGFEGSAAVPSTVEVYSDSIRRFSTDVPAGPFTLTDLPFGTGSGNAQVIVRDVTGRETRIDLPFLVSSDLLRKGMADYALSFGRPRLGLGTDSDRYGDGLFGVATLRYGFSDSLTVSAHLEAGEDLKMAGLGATFRLGNRGTATLSLARSESDFGSGMLGEASGALSFGQFRASARIMRSQGDFSDIALSTAEGTDSGHSPLKPIAGLNQLSLSLPTSGKDGTAASVFYADTTRADGKRDKSLGLAYTRSVFNDGTLNLSLLGVRAETSDIVVGMGLHVPFGKRRYVSASVEHRDRGVRQSLTASGESEDRGQGWNWRMQAIRDAHSSVQASAGREFTHGRIEVASRLSESAQSVGLRAQGSVVVAGGGIFLSKNIHDAFAVVDAGAPGVDVRFENRIVGTTGNSGKLLVPGLRSYDSNSLAIDTESLPVDADVQSTRKSIRPALRSGVKVDFGVNTNPASAVVELLSADGAPMPVGLTAELSGTGESFLIGYDGLVYALGLGRENRFVVRRTDGSSCQAEFFYQQEPGTITQINGVVCR